MNFFLSFILVLFSSKLIAQELNSSEKKGVQKVIRTSLSFQKMDVFSSLTCDFHWNHWSFESSFGTGINRTFYQGRFFPQVEVGVSHMFYFRNNKVRFGPEIQLFTSTFRILERHYFASSTIGYNLQIGTKWLFIQQVSLGVMQENFRNVHGDFNKANSTNYKFSIGLGYAFD